MKVSFSKFAIAIEANHFMLLYNSLEGINSLCKINKNKYKELESVFYTKQVIEYKKEYEELTLRNILVDNSFNEESYRKFKKK